MTIPIFSECVQGEGGHGLLHQKLLRHRPALRHDHRGNHLLLATVEQSWASPANLSADAPTARSHFVDAWRYRDFLAVQRRLAVCSMDRITIVLHTERLIDCSTEKAGSVQYGWDK